jgi:hypothetical protein
MISSSLLWLTCVLAVLGCALIPALHLLHPIFVRHHRIEITLGQFSIVFCFFSALAAISYIALRVYWFKKQRSPGFGFWRLTMLFYSSVQIVAIAGLFPYLYFGIGSMVTYLICGIGLTFCILGFPRLPGNNQAEMTAETDHVQ